VSTVVSYPEINSRWRSRNGAHKGMEVVVKKTGGATVVVLPISTNKKRQLKNGALTWRLPLDAFYRRYERAN
jgi:hypothetical protein